METNKHTQNIQKSRKVNRENYKLSSEFGEELVEKNVYI